MDKKLNQYPKPFLKWAGGKKQLLCQIYDNLPDSITESKKIKKYFEPFLGGGALFFFLKSMEYEFDDIYLSDINKELILTYKVIQKDPGGLIDQLKVRSEEYIPKSEEDRKKYYYEVRKDFNNDLQDFNFEKYSKESYIRRASQMIFLNKTCFNGLFRVNSKGEFNVPAGRNKKPLICDEKNIYSVSEALQCAKICDKDYSYWENFIDSDSLVYLDPPYRPINNTSSFNGYSKIPFDDNCQEELGIFYKKISDNGAKVLLSNSYTNDNFFERIYGGDGFTIHKVTAKRFINSKGNGRGPVTEILVTNF